MEYFLENDTLKLKIASHGAEMKSLIKKSTGIEYLWKADPAYWGRTAPVLFPIVGRVVDDNYTVDGKKYEMHQHGFARDNEFDVVSQSDTEITFSLKSNNSLIKLYPYDFELLISYKLTGNTLSVTWTVKNPSNDVIYYSLGGHPAFACPLNDDEKQSDYSIYVETDNDELTCAEFDDGYVTGNTYKLPLDNKKISITPHLFDNDALVVENHQAQKVSLLDASDNEYLSVSFDAPVFGLWSCPGKEAPFVCIEPWYGRCDNKNFNGDFKDREWGNTLNPVEEFNGGFTVEIK